MHVLSRLQAKLLTRPGHGVNLSARFNHLIERRWHFFLAVQLAAESARGQYYTSHSVWHDKGWPAPAYVLPGRP